MMNDWKAYESIRAKKVDIKFYIDMKIKINMCFFISTIFILIQIKFDKWHK
jgi:hypothetical protein